MVEIKGIKSIQESDCFPHTAEARTWPVKAFYLHGLFSPRSNTDFYGKLEADNRQYLESLATRMHFRIAVPVSDDFSSSGYRYWNEKSLADIETAASNACGAPLASRRALIGFSNGGYAARRISYLRCEDLAPYVKILAIGFPERDHGSCGNYVHVVPHVFPPADESFFDTQLAGLGATDWHPFTFASLIRESR